MKAGISEKLQKQELGMRSYTVSKKSFHMFR